MVRKYGEITHPDLYGNRWLLIWEKGKMKRIELSKNEQAKSRRHINSWGKVESEQS